MTQELPDDQKTDLVEVRPMPTSGYSYGIPVDTRARVHVLRDEGMTFEEISKELKISEGSISNILAEGRSQYPDAIERAKVERAIQWGELAEGGIGLAKQVQELLRRGLAKALDDSEVGAEALSLLQRLADCKVDVKTVMRDAAIAQDKQSLLQGDPTTRSEQSGQVKHFLQMTPQQRAETAAEYANGIRLLEEEVDDDL